MCLKMLTQKVLVLALVKYFTEQGLLSMRAFLGSAALETACVHLPTLLISWWQSPEPPLLRV